MSATDTRSIEIELQIDAGPEQVWKALTDAEELQRWFPFAAEVVPGEGGSIRLSWGPNLDGRGRIHVWEPPRRLRTGWFETQPQEGEAPDTVFYRDDEVRRRLVVDYHLEGKAGRTVLRLVHSGFSAGADWDREYDGHRRGWTFELRSLRNYLEHHRSKDRSVAWVRRPIEIEMPAAWSRLVGADALLAEGSLEGRAPGDRYAFTTADGERFEGDVLVASAPTEFAGTVDRGHAMTRFGVEDHTGRPEAYVWLSTWGDPARADAFRQRWTARLDELF